MTTVAFGASVGVGMLDNFFPLPDIAVAVTETSTSFILYYDTNEYDKLSGSGFKYDDLGYPFAGTISSWTYVLGGQNYFSATSINMQVSTYMSYFYADDWMGFLQTALAGNDTVTGTSGEDDLYGFTGNDTIKGGNAQDTIHGGDGNDKLNGDAGDDSLFGEGGNDTLDGGLGADHLDGGSGSDTYIVDNVGDSIQEVADPGVDLILASVSVGLGANVENATLTGSGANSITGNDLANILTGNSAANVLDGGSKDDQLFGGAGNDTLIGGLGNDLLDGGVGADALKGGDGDDTYIVDNVLDTISEETSGDDLVKATVSYILAPGSGLEDLTLLGKALQGTGNELANTITGNDGANVLDGKGGADTLIGGKGADTYIVDNVGDVVDESVAGAAGGVDLVKSSVGFDLSGHANIEKLTLTGTDPIDGTGNDLNNLIVGNAGANRLDGGKGNDTLTGGEGDDTYVVDSLKDKIVESLAGLTGGKDTVESSITFSLASLGNIENLTLTGSGNTNGTGNKLDNLITGNDGNNLLDGGAGNDTLIGGKGNDTLTGGLGADDLTGEEGDDTYNLDQTDTVHEAVGEGTDLGNMTATMAGLTFDLSTNYQNFENFTLLGKLAGNIAGNDLANILTGNSAANLLDGGSKDDQLFGSAGNDTLIGGLGNDLLDGGVGADALKGGDGDDTYVVDNVLDTISDETSGDDVVKSTVSYILAAGSGLEDLTLLGKALQGTGNELANTITGNDGANILDGQGGADTLIGGKGADTYIVDNVGDVVDESVAGAAGGVDLVKSSVGFDLSGHANIENLTLTGTDPINGTGNDLNNLIVGNAGANRLDGGKGNDTLTGGEGNDTYVVDSTGDKVVESITNALNGGTDTVESSITFSLASLGNVDNLTLTGSANTNGTGNKFDNLITGNDGNNLLDGAAGNDTLIGGKGNDILTGGLGNDTLDGGGGSNTAKFSGLSTGYSITNNGGIYTIVDLSPTANGNDGTDTLTNIGFLQFKDKTIILDLPPGPISDSNVTANSAAENAANGTLVGITASATDPDAGDTITYSLTDSAGGRFAIDGTTGVVTVANGSLLDFETATSHSITVKATDTGGLFSTQSFSIGIGNANETPGSISDSNVTANSVAENAANGTLVGITASATDPDAGDTITYSLTDSAGGRFAIDGSTGVVTVANGSLLDYETATSHSITVKATDTGGLFSTQSFSIGIGNANETPGPVSDANGTANSVAENAANGTLVGITASATDPDAGDTITYSLTDSAGGRFAIDGTTGVVTVANGSLLDFETATSHSITVKATDTGGLFSTQSFSIGIGNANETPGSISDSNVTANSVAENAANGTLVGITASATDPDAGDTITYSLTESAGGRFAIDGSTGVVTVANGSLLDYETATSHSITVKATDTGGLFSTQSFSIGIGNANETPGSISDSNVTANSVAENAANGTLVGITASATDPDAGDTITYSLTDSAGGRFAIDGSTGVVTVANGSLLDYETATSHSITVKATDTGGLFSTQSFSIGIGNANETPGSISDSNVTANSVAENAANGTLVGITASATDPDAGDTITYSLTESAGGRFAIDGSTGVVTVANGSLLDYETATSHSITVKATDTGGLFSTQSFSIGIGNANETPGPVSDANGTANSVAENAANGTLVGITASATDPDAGDTITYSLTESAGGRFAIDGTTGVVTVANGILLDFESATSHSITVKATDAGGLFSTQSFSIGVADVHDVVDLSTLDGITGFRLDGGAKDDVSGFSVSSAGDINGDGFADVIVGAFRADPDGVLYGGATYLVFGGASSLALLDTADGFADGCLDLSALNGATGFRLDGAASGDQSGYSVSSAGDVNGDGFDDLIIGAIRDLSYAGATYVVFGGGINLATLDAADGIADGRLGLSALNGVSGFRLDGAIGSDFSGNSVSSVGDVNGDGFDDLIIGARRADPDGVDRAGASYLVFGGATSLIALDGADGIVDGHMDLSELNGTTGFRLDGGAASDYSGISVSAAGDVDGDGFDDFIVGATSADPDGVYASGASYLVFGGAANLAALDEADGLADGHVNLTTLNGTAGFRLDGGSTENSGRSVASAGDMNGDGFDDFIVGAPNANPDGANSSGATYVVFGGTANLAALDTADGVVDGHLNLTSLNFTTGFRLDGVAAGNASGSSVSSAGDVNGDGFDDLVIGATRARPDGLYSGAAYVVFGGAANLVALDMADGAADGHLNLTALNGITGFRLDGIAAQDFSGYSVSSAGDVNGDGFSDLIVGAPFADPDGVVDAGASYVVFGGNFSGGVTYLGTTGDDTLTGSSAAETFVGGLGGDTLIGGGGRDAFQGGAGNDTLVLGLDTPLDVDGGSGIDTAKLDALGPSIDLSGLLSSRFNDIEKIDLSGTQANTLILDQQAVFDIVGANGDLAPDNTLLVKGDAGDHLTLSGAWTKGSVVSNPMGETGSYTTYTDGVATVLVESDLVVFGSTLDLSALNGTTGFRLDGGSADDRSGLTVSSAGDVNGDGFDDLIVGGYLVDPDGVISAGASYVVFGKADAWTSALDLSSLNGNNGFRLDGQAFNDFTGFAVSSAGDVNGDGFDDLIIGAPFADPDGVYIAGASYVVFGKSDGWGVTLDLSTLSGTNGFRLDGVAALDESGRSVSSAGDVNGDGFDDLFVGAHNADPDGVVTAGISYVVFGGAANLAVLDAVDGVTDGHLDLSALNGATGFRLDGFQVNDQSGASVSLAGDVNGDGFDDLIVGARYADPDGVSYSGASYLVFGGAANLAALDKADGFSDGQLNLTALDGMTGFRLDGAAANETSGWSVSSAGDVSGDGIDDLIVGAIGAEPETVDRPGASYLVFGGVANLAALDAADGVSDGHLNLSTLSGPSGFRLDGGAATDYSGRSVSSAGDLNGDGFDDLIIGARNAHPNGVYYAGASYVVFGGIANLAALDAADGTSDGHLDLTALDGTTGFRLDGGTAYDRSGTSVSSAGDVNGDGFDDLIVGAVNADPDGVYNAGASYVVFGGNFTGAVTRLGTAGNDTLIGSSAAETFVGGLGDDTLNGGGGADAIQGGAGNDTLVLGVDAPLDVDGGSGIDTVMLDAIGPSIDLSGLLSSRFNDIEKIDLSGNNSNTLVLDQQAVFDIVGANGDLAPDNTLLVKGDVGDHLTLSGAWTKGSVVSNPMGETGSYTTYTDGAATVLVKNGLTVHASTFDLSMLDGATGLRLDGNGGDTSGNSVSSAGDVNGDGFDDLIIGAYRSNPDGAGHFAGTSYLVFGGADNLALLDAADGLADGHLDLTALNGTTGFRLDGSKANDYSGYSVSSAGDVNGDGFDDLIVGAFIASPDGVHYAGTSYVVFGGAANLATLDVADGSADGHLDLSALNGTTGSRLDGFQAIDESGISVSSAGDMNGDGFDDILVGARLADPDGISNAGASYVVFGQAAGWSATLDLSTLNGATGFRLDGESDDDQSGFSSSSAGDLNGDGFDDVIVGTHFADPGGFSNAGASYLVFGHAGGWGATLDLSTLNGATGFRIDGAAAYNWSGFSVSSARDVNGDGFDDLIIGAPNATPDGIYAGASYVVFGHGGVWDSTLGLSTLDGTNGFRLDGNSPYDRSGYSVSSAGDVNGDGFDDLIIGANFANPNGVHYAGASYVVFGHATGWSASLDLSTLDGTTGFRLDGPAAYDFSGFSVSSAGDVNGDGFGDVVVGARLADPDGVNQAGASYVVFGGNFTGAVTHLGTAGNDTLTGSLVAETFVGGLGDDTLNGGGGADSFQGGAGNDTFIVNSTSVFKIEGGLEFDSLVLDGSGLTLDLTLIGNDRISGIERIDLTGSGNNSLKLNIGDVLDMSDTSTSALTPGDASHVLLVSGDAGDAVVFGSGWSQAGSGGLNGNGTSTIAGQVYQHFTAGEATLLVDTDIIPTVS